MSYELWDGFDHYNASFEMWPFTNGTMSYGPSYARFAAPAGLLGQGLKMAASGAQYKGWTLSGNRQTMIFGFAIYFPSLGSGSNNLIRFQDTSTVQCSLNITSAGAIQLVQGTAGTVLASTAPGVISPRVWHWLDIEITIASGSGAISIYIDEPAGASAVLNATSLNTQQSANAYMNVFYIGDFGAVFQGLQLDDFHAHTNSGSAPNSILGDSRIYTKIPNAAGYQTQWTPNGASANYQCVDDSIPDGDTTYVSSSTAGQIDGYAVPTAGFTGAPNGVVRRSYIRKDDASTHTFQNGVRSSSTNGLGTAVNVPSSYAWFDSFFADDPATSAVWTAAGADAAQMIIDETS